jgi:hypothetical protein
MNIQNENTRGETPLYKEQMEPYMIDGETPVQTGRPAIPIVYTETSVDGETCMKGIITTKGTTLEILFDTDDYDKVKRRQWFASTGGKYVCCNVRINGVRKVLGLHNFIMNKFDFPGKGAKESVDHINRNGLDNRKSNLRIISQTLQNVNKKARGRTAVLPEGISLPKHIWYIKANGLHGDRFCVELKTEGICWKTTSSKKVSIEDKLKQAIAKRDELYAQFPYLSNA